MTYPVYVYTYLNQTHTLYSEASGMSYNFSASVSHKKVKYIDGPAKKSIASNIFIGKTSSSF